MSRAELRRFLTDVALSAALDGALLRLAETDADAAFAGYGLDEDDRVVLRRRDAGVLSLLARALAPERAGDAAQGDDTVPADTPDTPVAPVASAPAPPAVTPPVVALPEVAFSVHVRPQAVVGPDGAWHVTCAVSVQPFAPAPTAASPAAASPSPATAQRALTSPWAHRTDDPESHAAARAVLAASPEDRRARLIDLVAALRGPGSAR